MGSNTSNIGEIQQKFMNNITQEDQQNCIATVQSTTNDNVVIVQGATIDGNFTGVSSTVNTDATCLMVSNMEDTVRNMLSATLQQTNEVASDMAGDFSWQNAENKFDINQSVVNNISQINEATCAANTTSSTDNNYVYVSNSKVRGDFIGVSNKANATANCSMTNSMKNTTYNQAQASATQSNTVLGMFVAIAAVIAGVIGVIVFGVIILFAVGAIGYVGYKGYSGGSSEENPEDQELQAVQELGLTPDVLSQLPTE